MCKRINAVTAAAKEFHLLVGRPRKKGEDCLEAPLYISGKKKTSGSTVLYSPPDIAFHDLPNESRIIRDAALTLTHDSSLPCFFFFLLDSQAVLSQCVVPSILFHLLSYNSLLFGEFGFVKRRIFFCWTPQRKKKINK